MSQVRITDATLEAEFKKSTDTVMVHGTDGRIIGMYTPIDPASLSPRISEAEIQLRIQSGGGRKLSQILADLEARV